MTKLDPPNVLYTVGWWVTATKLIVAVPRAGSDKKPSAEGFSGNRGRSMRKRLRNDAQGPCLTVPRGDQTAWGFRVHIAPHNNTMFTDPVLHGDAYDICTQWISMLLPVCFTVNQEDYRHVHARRVYLKPRRSRAMNEVWPKEHHQPFMSTWSNSWLLSSRRSIC